MTDKEILEKAFMIATHNGFQQRDEEPDVFMIPEAFIYRHEFAKALWANPDKSRYGDLVHGVPKDFDSIFYEWQHHLQQMVIADDPIQYLGQHLYEQK